MYLVSLRLSSDLQPVSRWGFSGFMSVSWCFLFCGASEMAHNDVLFTAR